MIDKQTIIVGYFRQGKSKKKLARELGISPHTVRKYIKEFAKEMDESVVEGGKALPDSGVIHPPQYDSSNRVKRTLTKEVQKILDDYISKNKIKRDQGKHKLQMQKKDMHEALLERGYKIGYTTVCRYVRHAERLGAEVFIRQHYEPGQCVEFDWAEVKLIIDGRLKRLMMAVFTSSYSNHRWAQLFYRQDMSSFLHSHACYFAHVERVARQMVYDNMRVAVRKFTIRNSDKEPTEDLLKMSCYYQFDYRFCNGGKGNEKGHVERSVEYVRRKAFCVKDEFDSIEAANAHLLQTCSRLNQLPVTGKAQSIQEVFEQELEHMKQAPVPYDTAQLTSLRIDKYSCIKVDTNWYSVPEGFVGHRIDVKIYPLRILIYSPDNRCIAVHRRRHTRFEYYLNLDHYLETLRTKPGALRGSLSLSQADLGLRQIFFLHFEKSPREFIELLLFARKHDYEIVHLQKAIDKCISCCPHHPVSLDKLKILLSQKQDEPAMEQPTEELSKSIVLHCHKQLLDIQSLIL